MWVCLDCQHIFEEGKHYVEEHGLDAPPYEEFDGCPECGGAYVEAKKCDCCGEYITGDYIKTKNDERLCDHCFTQMTLGDED